MHPCVHVCVCVYESECIYMHACGVFVCVCMMNVFVVGAHCVGLCVVTHLNVATYAVECVHVSMCI